MRPRLPRLRRPRRRDGAAPGHDRADRARRGDALRDRAAAAALLLLRPRLPRRCARTAARCASSCRRASSCSARPAPRRDGRGAHACCATRSTPSGLRGYRIALGDARRCTRRCWTRFDVPDEARERLLDALARRDFVGLEREVARRSARRTRAAAARAAAARRPRGARRDRRRRGRRGCARSSTLLDAGVAERIIFDLGLARGLGYYTGAVFDVLDPALGEPLGGGGRYDDLLGALRPAAARRRLRAGRRPAAPRRWPARRARRLSAGTALTIAVPRGALLRRDARPARRASASTPPRSAPTTASCCSTTSAS